jgi:hypothetical protein
MRDVGRLIEDSELDQRLEPLRQVTDRHEASNASTGKPQTQGRSAHASMRWSCTRRRTTFGATTVTPDQPALETVEGVVQGRESRTPSTGSPTTPPWAAPGHVGLIV